MSRASERRVATITRHSRKYVSLVYNWKVLRADGEIGTVFTLHELKAGTTVAAGLARGQDRGVVA